MPHQQLTQQMIINTVLGQKCHTNKTQITTTILSFVCFYKFCFFLRDILHFLNNPSLTKHITQHIITGKLKHPFNHSYLKGQKQAHNGVLNTLNPHIHKTNHTTQNTKENTYFLTVNRITVTQIQKEMN